MNNRRLLALALIVMTLSIGVVIGTLVSGRVRAGEQKPAPLIIPDPVSLSNAFSQIAAQLDPTVVNISIEQTIQQQRGRGGRGSRQQADPFGFFDFFGNNGGGGDANNLPERATGVGTGFIVDKSGYIITNHHVVDKADKITVRLDDKSEHPAKVIGSDEETDLAVIKIDAGRELPVAKMGNSDPVKVGDWVLAIGSPFRFDHTVTAGIVSAKGRDNLGGNGAGSRGQFQSFIQTDAAINPGNSGGPLVNMAAEVIGINTAIISETGQFAGLGFALPSNTAVKIYNQLIANGKVTRGGIGITYLTEGGDSVKRAYGVKEGVVIDDVLPAGPASKAGLRPGDIILEIDGKTTPSGSVLVDIVANEPIGKSIPVKYNRDGRVATANVAVTARENILNDTSANAGPANKGGDQAPGIQGSLGLHVEDVTAELARKLNLPSQNGVYVTSVDRGSAAFDAGLRDGYVLLAFLAAGQTKVDFKSLDDFRRAEKLMKSGSEAVFQVMFLDPRTNRYRNSFVTVDIP